MSTPLTAADPATSGRRAPGALLAAVLGFFVVTLDSLVVNVAVPDIGADLKGGLSGMQWVVDGYTLMLAALLLSAGSLSDRIGARRTFTTGMVLFVAASTACGLAPNQALLIGSRMIQGAGAAAILPSSLSLIREAYPDPARRGRVIALWTVAGSIAAAAGPVAGGALNLISWRMIFFINVPVGLVALASALRASPSPQRPVAFDLAGQLTVIVGIGALVYGLIAAGSGGFRAADVIVALVAAAVGLVGFATSQVCGRHPMAPPALLRSRVVVISALSGFAFLGAFTAVVFLFSLYLQQQRGLSALQTGLVFLPTTLLSAAISPVSTWLTHRYSPLVPILGGLTMMALAMLALAGLPAPTPTWLLSVLLIPIGITGPLAMQPTIAVLLDSVPAHQSGLASGVFNSSRQIGGALSIAAFGALLSASDQLITGLRHSLIIAAVVVLLAATANAIFRPHHPDSLPVPSRRDDL
jgi:EmrB/QacA subfamily drug resistance transporter